MRTGSKTVGTLARAVAGAVALVVGAALFSPPPAMAQ